MLSSVRFRLHMKNISPSKASAATLLEKISVENLPGLSSVQILGTGTALPPFEASQDEALEFVLAHLDVRESTRTLYRRTFLNKSIKRRFFAVDRLADVLEQNHERISARFQKWAVKLSTESLAKALTQAELSPDQIDF